MMSAASMDDVGGSAIETRPSICIDDEELPVEADESGSVAAEEDAGECGAKSTNVPLPKLKKAKIPLGARMPASLVAVLNETQENPSIKVNFGDKLAGAHQMVLLGCQEVKKTDFTEASASDKVDSLVTSLLCKVMAANSLARKVVLVSSAMHVGIVDRAHLDDVIFRASTLDISYYDLKTVGTGKRKEAFIVFVARSSMFSHDMFYVLQGKSNWGADKIKWVELALDLCVTAANARSSHTDVTLTANSDVFHVPSNATVHRVKYLGSYTKMQESDDAKMGIIKIIGEDSTDMGKQTKTKTVQHIIDYAQEAVFVGVVDGLRVIDSATMSPLTAGIVPNWINRVDAIDLEDLLSDSSVLKLMKKQARLSRSPSPIRRGRSSKGKAGASSGDVRDMAVCITWKDDQVDVVKVEILIVKGEMSKAAAVVGTINVLRDKATERRKEDPFAPRTKPKAPRSDILAEAEVDRNNVVALDMIGSGMFGEVYLANQHLTSEDAESIGEDDIHRAVKTLRQGSNKTQRNEFCTEAEIQLQLQHKNIVQVTGVCMTQEPYLCVLEFLPYGDLSNVLHTAKKKGIEIAAREQVCFLLQLADALQFMHSRNYVHMDVAARNVLVGENSHVKLADFGLTREYDEGQRGYRLQGKMKLPMLWTPPECMPPLVTRGENVPVEGDEIPFYDESTDMWSFGVTVWEVLSYGEKPYSHLGSLVEKLVRVYNGYRLESPPDADPTLQDATAQALATEPGDRPSFSRMRDLLLERLESLGGRGAVVDVGVLLSEGRAQLVRRRSHMVAQTRRASMRAPVRSSDGHDVALGTVKEEDEDASNLAPSPQDAAAVSAAESISTDEPVRKSSVSKWATIRAIMPFYYEAVWRQNSRNQIVRTVSDDLPEEILDVDSNPFDSDESDGDDSASNHDSSPKERKASNQSCEYGFGDDSTEVNDTDPRSSVAEKESEILTLLEKKKREHSTITHELELNPE